MALDLPGLIRRLSAHDVAFVVVEDIDPYLRGAPPGLPFRLDTATRGLDFTLTTTMGDLDLWGEVAGGGTYESLAAGRPKDLNVLAELDALADEVGGDG